MADEQPPLWIATSTTLASHSSFCVTAAMRAVDSSSPRPRGRRRGDLWDTSIRFSVEEEERMESGGPRLGLHADTGRRGPWCGRRGGSRAAGQAPGGGRRSGVRSLLRRVREDSRTPDPWLNGCSPTYPDPTVDIVSSPDRTVSGLAGYVDPLPTREKTQLSYRRDRDSITILLWDPPKSTWEKSIK
jgi:hypothetical protein